MVNFSFEDPGDTSDLDVNSTAENTDSDASEGAEAENDDHDEDYCDADGNPIDISGDLIAAEGRVAAELASSPAFIARKPTKPKKRKASQATKHVLTVGERKQAVARILKGEVKAKDVAAQYNKTPPAISKWVKAYKDHLEITPEDVRAQRSRDQKYPEINAGVLQLLRDRQKSYPITGIGLTWTVVCGKYQF